MNELKTHVLSEGENHSSSLTDECQVEMQVQFSHIFQLPKNVNLNFNIKFLDCLNFGGQNAMKTNYPKNTAGWP